MSRGNGVKTVGNNVCEITFQYRGERCRERVPVPNTKTKAGLKFAADLKSTIEHEISIGKFDYLEKFPRSKRARRLAKNPAETVSPEEMFSDYMSIKAMQIQPEQVKDYWETINHDWLPFFKSKSVTALAQVNGQLIQSWIDTQTDTSRKRIANQLVPLRGAVARATKLLVLPNPLVNLELKRAQLDGHTRGADPFKPAEIEAIRKQVSPMVSNMIQSWAWTGLRFGEMAALRWCDVDLARGILYVTSATRGTRVKGPKTRSSTRVVKTNGPARLALEAQKELTGDGERVWQNPTHHGHGGQFARAVVANWTSDKSFRLQFEAACLAAGVRYRGPRHLRHTYASWQLSAGESILFVSRQLGHKDSSVTQKLYARWIPDVDPQAGTRAERQFATSAVEHAL